MAEEVVATIPGPLNSFSFSLSVNNASTVQVRAFGISGRTAKFPVTIDSMGSFSGPATLLGVAGVDTEVVTVRLSGFGPGETIRFSGMDPDFTGDMSSGVRVGDMKGARFIAYFSDGRTGFGEFQPGTDGGMTAVATK